MKKFNINLSLLIGIMFIAALTRLLPHPPNFSPILAIGIFGAAHFTKKWHALFISIFAIWFSDLIINNYIYTTSLQFVWFYKGFQWQYGSYLSIILLNIYVFKNNISLSKTFGTAVGSGAIFFLVSNFGVWIGSGMYSKNIIGLLACYTAGIPFLQNTIISNLLFTTVLFGSYYLIQSEYSSIKDKQLQYS